MGIFTIFRILEGRFARFGRFSRIDLDSRGGPVPILENRTLFSKIRKNRPRFSERSSPDSRESEPILENRSFKLRISRIGSENKLRFFENRPRFSRIGDWASPRINVYSWESSRIGFDSRESGLALSENRALFSRIFRISRIFPPRFGRFRRFPRIDLDSRGSPVPILENRSLFSKNRILFSRIGSDSQILRESNPILENRLQFSRLGTGPPRESKSILGNLRK